MLSALCRCLAFVHQRSDVENLYKFSAILSVINLDGSVSITDNTSDGKTTFKVMLFAVVEFG